MKNKFMTSVLKFIAHSSRLTAHCSLLTAAFSRLIARRSLLTSDLLITRRALFTAALLTALSSSLFSAFAATPGFDTLVNYDTAWTYVYDGGVYKVINVNTPTPDILYDIKILPNGKSICVGETRDTTGMRSLILFCLDGSGKQLWKRLYWFPEGSGGRSITIAKNKDFIIAGFRYVNPLILRTDTLGNIKWSTWLYDSVNNRQTILTRASATINSVRETKRGTIICAAGDYFTDGNYIFGNIKYDYAAVLQFDSTGKFLSGAQAGGQGGFAAGGFYCEEISTGNFIVSGNQAIINLDTTFKIFWEKKYTFSLNGVGAEVNNITRCKMLRDGSLVVAGMAYEGNCWTNFGKLYYDAWWSPISYSGGTNSAWDTAGFQGGNDAIYDFTQLNNGNIVFIGSRANGPGGIWTFVTDSTGKKLLWEKQNPIPYKSNPGSSARGYSVCATDDGGFTVAGELVLVDSLGGHNAMAAHFVSKPITAVVLRSYSAVKSVNGFNVHISGAKLIVSSAISAMARSEVALFDISGKRVFNATSPRPLATPLPQARGENNFKTIQFDISKLAHGTYFVRVKAGAAEETMLIRVIP